MTDAETPIPLDAVNVVELSEKNAPRTCGPCGDDADYYAFVTDGAAADHADVNPATDEWPLNTFYCRDCFADAPRVRTLAEAV